MKLLLVCNNAPLYRQAIFSLMDQTFDCDWVFGEALGDIKQFDVTKLRGKVSIVKNVSMLFGKAYWQRGVVKQLFKGYSHYILLGEERCLSTWVFIFLSRLTPSKKVYFWTHGAYGREHGIKLFVSNLFFKMVDGSFIYNNYSRELLIKRGFSADTLFTIHNSLDYDKQVALRKQGLQSDEYKLHFRNENPVLLFIGRLTKVKKLDMLIDAVAILKKQGHQYNLVFVGDGSEGKILRDKVNDLGLTDQVWFYGACYDEKANASLIYNADLCVAPGNVGLTAMHSMVFGTPVVSHNNFPWQMPEFEAIHPGDTGDFFEMDNVESLAFTIQSWFSTGKDRETVRQACYHEIDTQWNPYFQIEVLKKNLK